MSEPIPSHVVEVLEAWSPTPSTRAVRVARPAGLSFTTAQSMRFFADGAGGHLARPLSIASSAERPFLEFVVRLSSSDFKRAFASLSRGDRVQLWGPRGRFQLDWSRPALMLAGGIGVTPFRSMLQTQADRRAGPRTALVYASHEPSDVPFAGELSELAATHHHIEVVHLVSRVPQGETWTQRVGRVDLPLLRDLAARYERPVWYVAGPEGFVRVSSEIARALGGDPADVRVEIFPRYLDDLATAA
jgi:ferredoxin-NADP reductase